MRPTAPHAAIARQSVDQPARRTRAVTFAASEHLRLANLRRRRRRLAFETPAAPLEEP
jgi:hypothetical protein